MANILGLITVNDKQILEVDAVPSASAGTPAPIGSSAMFDDGLNTSSSGSLYTKSGPNDIDWEMVLTDANSGVAPGSFLRIPLYDTSPSGNHLADSVLQNTKSIDLTIVAQPARSVNIEYTVPNPGDAVAAASFVLTEGAQTINGSKTFGGDVVVQGGLTVNGTLVYINSTQTQIADPLITLNKGGATGSGAGVGFEIEESGSIVGYFKTTADRKGFAMMGPNNAFQTTLDMSLITAARVLSLPDTAGTFVARPSATPGVLGQLAFWSNANNIISDPGLYWDNVNDRLSIGSGNTPTNTLDLTGTFRMRDMTLGSILFAGTNGVVSQDNANFFWDSANHKLGLGTATPARLLDVNGISIFRGTMRFSDAATTSGDWEVFQAQTATTGATQTLLASLTLPSDCVVLVTANVTARRTGGTAGAAGDSATYIRTVKVKNVGGTVSAPKAQADYTSEDNRVWDADLVVSGTAITVQVTGDANNNIDWTVTYFVQLLS